MASITTVSTRDVVVVGAGPVGALTALGLAQRGHDVLLLEATESPAVSPRAIVYYWHVLDGLDRLGVLADMDRAGFRNTAFRQRVLATGTEATISLEPISDITDRPWNVHLGQHEATRIALEHLDKLPRGELRRGAAVTGLTQDDDGATVEFVTDGEPATVRARWVVGTDGARSTVRRALGVSFDGTTWPDRFVATDLRYPFDGAGFGNANMVMSPDDGCVIARIDDSGLWRWTWGEPAELPQESVPDRLPGRFAALGLPEHPYEVVTATPYRMHQRAAQQMRTARVLLAGDAAHATNPTGGIGLTSGMYDVFALLNPLDDVLRGGSDSGLDAWADERRRIFLEHASPMASASKQMVYDERDLTRLEGMIRAAGAPVDRAEAVRRLSGMTVLRSGLPRHHSDFA